MNIDIGYVALGVAGSNLALILYMVYASKRWK